MADTSTDRRAGAPRAEIKIKAAEVQREFQRLEVVIDDLEADRAFNYQVWLRDGQSGVAPVGRFAATLRGFRGFAQRIQRESRRGQLDLLRACVAGRRREPQAGIANAIRQAEARGSIEPGEALTLKRQADRLLNEQLDWLQTHPCTAALRETCILLDDFLLVVDAEGIDRTLAGAAEAGRRIHVKTEQRFRDRPTIENFEQLLRSSLLCRILDVEVALEPEGWSAVGPGTRHRVAKGENLPRISERYYGVACFWDVIYRENAAVIRERVFDPGVGLELVIP